MHEKIKISVPSSVAEVVKKDCFDFRIRKADGTANLNAFLNTLAVNYYEEFSASEEALHDGLRTAIFGVPSSYREKTFDEILAVLAKKERAEYKGERSVSVSFKPTNASMNAIFHIENALISDESVSSFYRRMLISYSKRTKDEREKILHKEVYVLLKKAVDKSQTACIEIESGSVIQSASVYAVAASRDELFNYVLLYDGKKSRTLRLSKVKRVVLLSGKAEVPMQNREMFDRQIALGAQYQIYSTDDTPIRVQLTEKGKELFERIYLYRPVPAKIEGDVYTFECSANQVLYYFERFGENALILSPKKLGAFMRNYYYYALKKYRTVYGDRDY